MKKKWKLKISDVSTRSSSYASSFRKQTRNSGRIDDLRKIEIVLTHTPTEISVSGVIEEGNYSRKEMTRRLSLLKDGLLTELENKVARFLRIPGM